MKHLNFITALDDTALIIQAQRIGINERQINRLTECDNELQQLKDLIVEELNKDVDYLIELFLKDEL
tara:strand:+ start:1167 stop:1367 length:201 start_codon:yes stop_codon:yes gene_type:complete